MEELFATAKLVLTLPMMSTLTPEEEPTVAAAAMGLSAVPRLETTENAPVAVSVPLRVLKASCVTPCVALTSFTATVMPETLTLGVRPSTSAFELPVAATATWPVASSEPVPLRPALAVVPVVERATLATTLTTETFTPPRGPFAA